MSTQLIADAVYNQRNSEEATIWDRLFAVWFQRLVYNQIWEDPDADLAALELPPNATLVTISSAGCNALSYLVANPKQVYAADLNEAHLALLNLKIAGLRGLRNYDMFWRFFGAGDSSSNRELYREVMRPLLDVPSRSFWDGRDLTGRQRHRYFCNGFYRHGALGRFIGFAHLLARLYGIDLQAIVRGDADDRARREALARLQQLFQSRFARALTRSPALLFSLGIPPQQRKLLAGENGDLCDVLHDRILRLIANHPIETNYFAWQALQRRYPGPGDVCLPPYLQERHFDRMRSGANAVIPVHTNVRALLEALPSRHVDAVILLDSQDWMAPEEIRSIWQAIDRCGKDDVRVIFRTAGETSPLESDDLGALRSTWQRDQARSAIGLQQDRSGIYGGFHLYGRR
ncbi:MAG: S-adenosylmethionine-diacylglycerol 3-amino-3-carboxypropyl transferase [Alphaproteobacteria bacterium]|jgi:S-adenosylmethionine-diacylglycerol 3-amino-3-carboxypropyl transferase|nr:S-adenosylmethionine-diacylglycerol 3-amino-3-carboxypropyl transferase [Alphaproteobacteria bacterium]